MKKIAAVSVICLLFHSSIGQSPLGIRIERGEKWWGGAVAQAHLSPYGSSPFTSQLTYDTKGNQAQPLLISSHGRVIWSDDPFTFSFQNDSLLVSEYTSGVQQQTAGSTLRDAFLFASRNHFPPSGKTPDTLLFSQPQWNTWIELTYNQNQHDILNYAQSILRNGFKPGVLMIDDTWQEDYGVWSFHPGRFADASSMIKQLHSMGFKVMLWVCPFVSADAVPYRELKEKKGLLRDSSGEPAMIRWWNGASAVLDLTNPVDSTWFAVQLKKLQDSFAIDGFKFDAGDAYFYPANTVSFRKVPPNEQTALFGKIGLHFPLNEYRAMWKMGGQPLAERVADKNHTWEDLQKLVPQSLTQGLEGYPFVCPDMIGGGDFSSFLNRSTLDQGASGTFSTMSFTYADDAIFRGPVARARLASFASGKKAVALREANLKVIMQLVNQAAQDGEPVIRHMEYVFPRQNFDNVNDQFMLGNNLLVAPMVNKGRARTVLLPKGKWRADDGKVYKGPAKVKIDVPLERLPFFERTR